MFKINFTKNQAFGEKKSLQALEMGEYEWKISHYKMGQVARNSKSAATKSVCCQLYSVVILKDYTLWVDPESQRFSYQRSG